MASRDSEYLYEKSKQILRPSNEERLYGLESSIEGPAYPPAFLKPQDRPRKPKIRTYAHQPRPASNLRNAATANSSQAERRPSPDPSEAAESNPPSEDEDVIDIMDAPLMMEPHELRVTEPSRAALASAHLERIKANIPPRPDPEERMRLRIISMNNTPRSGRMGLRRQRSRLARAATNTPLRITQETKESDFPAKVNASTRDMFGTTFPRETLLPEQTDRQHLRAVREAGNSIAIGKDAAPRAYVRSPQLEGQLYELRYPANETISLDKDPKTEGSDKTDESLNAKVSLQQVGREQPREEGDLMRNADGAGFYKKGQYHYQIEAEDSSSGPQGFLCQRTCGGAEDRAEEENHKSQSRLSLNPDQRPSSAQLKYHIPRTYLRHEQEEESEPARAEENFEANSTEREGNEEAQENEDQDDEAQDGDESEEDADVHDSITMVEVLVARDSDMNMPKHHDAAAPSLSSSRSPKRRRPTPDHDSPDLYDLQASIEDAGGDDFNQATSKRRRRSKRTNKEARARGDLLKELTERKTWKEIQSRTLANRNVEPRTPECLEKQPRRLPINELVTSSEKMDISDAEDGEVPVQISEDPISQFSLSVEQAYYSKKGKKCVRRLGLDLRRGKGLGTFNISEFRMPKKQEDSTETRSHGMPSHSDGFEGVEAVPTGRMIPLRKPNRHRQSFQKVTLRFGELKLVAERTEARDLSSKKSKIRISRRDKEDAQTQPVTPAITVENEYVNYDDAAMVADNHEEQAVSSKGQAESEHHVRPDHITPPISTRKSSPPRVSTRNSPLQQKQRRSEKLTLEGEVPGATYMSQQPASMQPSGLSQASIHKDFGASRQQRVGPTPQKKMELSVEEQLMMVSLPRSSLFAGDGEYESEVESDLEHSEEGESESEQGSSEEEQDYASDENSEYEGPPQLENDLESEDEQEDVDMLEHGNSIANAFQSHDSQSHEEMKLEIPETQMLVPTLRRADAQNPIAMEWPVNPTHENFMVETSQSIRDSALALEDVQNSAFVMGRRQSTEFAEFSAMPAPRRRRSIQSFGRKGPEEDLLLGNNSESNHIVLERVQRKSNALKSISLRDNIDDYSWRPREPLTSSIAMEVENDDIFDPPTPAVDREKAVQRRQTSRKMSRVASQLSSAASRTSSRERGLPTMQRYSQGSIELGSPQVLLRRPSRGSIIPETQFEESAKMSEREEEQEDDIPTSQATYVPPASYFERASQDLQRSFKTPTMSRSKSMAASIHTTGRQEGYANTMEGSISMSAAFNYTMSSVKTTGLTMPTLMSSSGKEKSLRALTRQASAGMGTVPNASGRKRLVSLPFYPPFKKD